MSHGVEHLGSLPAASKVEALAGFGLSVDEIAGILRVEVTLLEAHFPTELAKGATEANKRVTDSLYRKALGDGREAVVAAIFWMKTRARWRETVHTEIIRDICDQSSA